MAFKNSEVKTFDLTGIEVAAGEHLRVRVTPDVLTAMNEECPEDESWNVTIHVRIEITDL